MTNAEFRILATSALATDDEFDLLLKFRDGKPMTSAELLELSNFPMASDNFKREVMGAATKAQAAELAASFPAKESTSTPLTPACSAAVPTCSLQDAAEWPDDLDSLSEADLWGYFNEGAIGCAKLYNRLNRDRIVFVPGWQRFLVWQGHHWVEDEYSIAYQRTESVVRAFDKLAERHRATLDDLGATKDEKKSAEEVVEKIGKKINSIRSKSGQENLLTQVSRVFNPLQVLPGEIDQKPYMLACPNGVVNLKTGALTNGRPSDYLLNACPTPFRQELLDSEDPCPETTKFLMASMNGNAEMVEFIWRILGYALIRERKDHVFVIMWGAHGRNGKDTLIKLLTHVLGKDLSGNVPVELFLQSSQTRNSSAPSPDVMALRGMCLAWVNEAEDGQRFAMAKLKALTGGGLITARGLMDKKMTTFQQTHLPVMTTNELPRAKADDDAFWARAVIIKWELSFVENPDPEKDYQRKSDKHLDSKIQAEAEGVLARLVRGAMEYVRDGLVIPEQVRAWTRDQRDVQDDLAAFLKECCVVEEKRDIPDAYQTRIRSKDLIDAWSVWYAENRDRKHIPSGKALGIMLDKREFIKKVSNGTWRLGLALNPEWESKMDAENGSGRRHGSTSFQGGEDANF